MSAVAAQTRSARRSWQDRAAFAAALAAMLLAAPALRVIPIRYLLAPLGRQIGAVACAPLTNRRQWYRARLIRRSIARAAKVTPLRNNCLPQALAGALLCRILRVPAAAHLGVRLEPDGELAAHAWLCAGPVAITGGSGFDEYTAVACFLSPVAATAETAYAPYG